MCLAPPRCSLDIDLFNDSRTTNNPHHIENQPPVSQVTRPGPELQALVAVEGAGQQLHGGDEDIEGLGEDGDSRVEFDFHKRG
jgi:hypothetical protein